MDSWSGEHSERVGILDDPQDPFVQDLVPRLEGVEVEFPTFGGEMAAPSGQFRVILDRASYRAPYLKEILKGLSLEGCYVINNPFTASATNKVMDLRLCHHLGIPVPRTLVLPDLAVQGEFPDSVAEPSWERVCQEIGFPCILKPYDGYGWIDVFVIQTLEELKNLYTSLGSQRIFMVQQLIRHTHYYRAFCIDQREVLFIPWLPRPLGAGEYLPLDPTPLEHLQERLITMTVELNACLDLDINVLEWCLDEEGKPWLIDAFNEVPDIPKDRLPESYYRWIVDRVCTCIRDKLLDPGRRNSVPFRPHHSVAHR